MATYNHREFTGTPIQVQVAQVDHQRTNAVQEHEDCKGDVELRGGREVPCEDKRSFPGAVTLRYLWR